MSQRTRLLIAMALALGILLLWGRLFPPRTPQEPPPETAPPETPAEPEDRDDGEMSAPDDAADAAGGEAETEPRATGDREGAPPQPPRADIPRTPPPPKEVTALRARLERDVTFETGHLRVVLTTRGGALKSLKIKDTDGVQYAIDLIDYEGGARERLSLGLTDAEEHINETAVYGVLEESGDRIVFASDWKDGRRLVKTYDFSERDGDSPYAFRLTLRFENTADKACRVKFRLNGSAGVSMADPFIPDIKGRVLEVRSDGSTILEKHDVSKVFKEPQEYRDRSIQWVAATNKYFAATLIYAGVKPPVGAATLRPLVPAEDGGTDKRDENNIVPALSYEVSLPGRKGEEPGVYEMPFIFYAGPREESKLRVLGAYHMPELVYMGWGIFAEIAKAILWFLKGINAVIGNFGIAIILMTILVRVAMFPLTKKQQASMQKMQKLGPKMKAIKEKFKSNKQKQNQEVMKLYKEHGVNPASGCLPMIIQIPIFFGLFSALRHAIDLRNQCFLYINDLSLPDGKSLGLEIDFTVPIIGSYFPYLNILPLVMIAVWVLQQALAPKSADPQQRQQQKMMMIMPIVFGFILYNYAAGLALYMTCNMFLGMVEQHVVKKMIAKQYSQDLPADGRGRKTAAAQKR